MKIKKIAVFFLIMVLSMGGCISFKIEPQPHPEQLVDAFLLCKKVLTDGELLAPSDVTTDFALDDPGVFCFVELKNIGRAMTLQWKWYTPLGTLYKETAVVPVNRIEAYLETVTAYDKLDVPKDQSSEGQWVVIVLVNGRLAGRRTFLVS
jgi:hypothetical protein